MPLTPNYSPNSLAPKIIITNPSDLEQYRFESEYNYPSPVNTLGNLNELSLELGINDNYGKLDFIIEDHGKALSDTTSYAKCKIKRQHNIQLYLGKTSATE